MPFTQQELDDVLRTAAALHGTTPEAAGIRAPRIGCDVLPADPDEPMATLMHTAAGVRLAIKSIKGSIPLRRG